MDKTFIMFLLDQIVQSLVSSRFPSVDCRRACRKASQSLRPLVVGEFLRDFKFLFDLLQAFAGVDHLGDFISHHDEVALLFFKVLDRRVQYERGP